MVNKKIQKAAILILFLSLIFPNGYSKSKKPLAYSELQVKEEARLLPQTFYLIKNAYPDVQFSEVFDWKYMDWKITIISEERKTDLYWCNGKFLPESELVNENNYWSLLYDYPKEIPDPANFTEDDIKRIREFSSPQNRKEGPGTPPFFYDAVYHCDSYEHISPELRDITFLGKRSTVHKLIREPLKKVQEEILAASKVDEEVLDFVNKLSQVQCFNWREIRDSKSRSFHSMGIAFDVLPKGWGQKNLYWGWRRDIDRDNWMKLPLDRRWMPPAKVIEIFENNGFIWGGKWIIWDNMHFEYRPEQIAWQKHKCLKK